MSMYKKGVAVEIQFSPDRLSRQADQSCLVGLDEAEARRLYDGLAMRFGKADETDATAAPMVVDLAARIATDMPIEIAAAVSADDFKQWVCLICGWVYDEEAGSPEEGLAPGTRFADIPDDWRCPLCDVGKEDFAVMEF